MRLRTIALTAALGLAVTGCATAPAASDQRSATPSTTTTKTATQQDKVDALVRVMQSKYPGSSRSQILDVAQTACDTLDEYGSVSSTFINIIADDSIDADMAGDMSYAIGVAVPVLCPEYQAELERLTK